MTFLNLFNKKREDFNASVINCTLYYREPVCSSGGHSQYLYRLEEKMH